MKIQFVCLTLLMLLFSTVAPGQIFQITGVISDSKTLKPLPFATIAIARTGKGTIANADGYFSISTDNRQELITCSYIGYQKQTFKIQSGQNHYIIQLNRSPQLISEVIIKADKSDRVYRIFSEIREQQPKTSNISKSYFESKTFCDGKQVELATTFYNLHSKGYEINKLDFKAGQIGFQPFEGRVFANIEASKSITNMSLFETAQGFPGNPFAMKAAELKKKYLIDIVEVLSSDEGDTIWMVSFEPARNQDDLFSGKAWLLPQKKKLLRIQLLCLNCQTHPFIPLTDADSISSVNISVNRTFKIYESGIMIDHSDFRLDGVYNSRYKSGAPYTYPIHTEAILYAYDPSSAFYVPKFEFPDSAISDYSKIFAFPTITSFWAQQKPHQLNDQLMANEKFLNDSTTLLNGKWTNRGSKGKERIFTTPYTHWSEKRTMLNTDKVIAKTNYSIDQQLPEEKYHLEVKIFMDLNRDGETLEVTTATILDPYATFFNFPSDSISNCFINLYFDLCESYRRKFQSQVAGKSLKEKQTEIQFAAFTEELRQVQKTFLKETVRGTRHEGLLKWNDIILQELGIDNMKLFNVSKNHAK